jgi:hypothetical protein
MLSKVDLPMRGGVTRGTHDRGKHFSGRIIEGQIGLPHGGLVESWA